MEFSTTISDVRDAIFSRFQTVWNNLTPISYDNIDTKINYTSDWLRLTLQFNNVDVSAIGNTRLRNTGLLLIQVFCLSDNSTSNNDIYIDKILANIPQTQIQNNITFREADINGYSINPDTNGVDYQTNINISFYYDTARS